MSQICDATRAAAAGVMLTTAATGGVLIGCQGVGSSRFVALPGAEPETREDALRLESGGLALEYSPEIDRITLLAPMDGENLLHVASLDQQPDPDGGYTFFGGTYFWVSPQNGPSGWMNAEGEAQGWPPDPAMDRGPARITRRSGDSFTAVNPADNAGLVQEKSVEIVGPGQVEVRVRLTNVGERSRARGVWINTATPGDAVIAIRLPGFGEAGRGALVPMPSEAGRDRDREVMDLRDDEIGMNALRDEERGGDAAAGEIDPELEGAMEASSAGVPGDVVESPKDEPDAEAEANERELERSSRVWAWNEQSPAPLLSILEGPDANGWYLIDLTRATWEGGVKFYTDGPAELAVWAPEGRGRESGFWLHRRQVRPVNVPRLVEMGEGPVALYIDPGAELIEAELYGPIVDLAPGESHEAIEQWTVYPAARPNTTFMNEANELAVGR